MLGPAFFVLLETSIKKGIRAALAFDAGVLIADVIYIVIAYVFIQQVEELSHGDDNAIIRAIGGILFIIYGYFTFFRVVSKVDKVKMKNPKFEGTENTKDYWIHFIKGLLLNLANPLVVFYWFSVMAFGHSGHKEALSAFEIFLFLGVVLGTFFTIDVIKIFGAKRLRPFITVNLLSSLNRITGGILMAFGTFLLINSIVMFFR